MTQTFTDLFKIKSSFYANKTTYVTRFNKLLIICNYGMLHVYYLGNINSIKLNHVIIDSLTNPERSVLFNTQQQNVEKLPDVVVEDTFNGRFSISIDVNSLEVHTITNIAFIKTLLEQIKHTVFYKLMDYAPSHTINVLLVESLSDDSSTNISDDYQLVCNINSEGTTELIQLLLRYQHISFFYDSRVSHHLIVKQLPPKQKFALCQH